MVISFPASQAPKTKIDNVDDSGPPNRDQRAKTRFLFVPIAAFAFQTAVTPEVTVKRSEGREKNVQPTVTIPHSYGSSRLTITPAKPAGCSSAEDHSRAFSFVALRSQRKTGW